MGLLKKGQKVQIDTWDMSTKESREKWVKLLFERAKEAKQPFTDLMVKLNNYYNGDMISAQQAATLNYNNGDNFNIPVLPDPYIQVESQIDPIVPQYEFKPREEMDVNKVKIRKDVVDYICYNNRLEQLNIENERNLNKLGNEFWKVSFDGSITGLGFIGDIVIGNPSPANIFFDPAAYEIDDCEYIIYSFRMHRRAARRIYGKIIDEIPNDNNHGDTEIFIVDASQNGGRSSSIYDDETLQIKEFWYKDEEGDIACVTTIGDIEVKFIPKYWVKTRKSGNKLYPFVHAVKTPVDQTIWGRGEIEAVLPLVDTQNEEFITAVMNDRMCANDIIIAEKDAFEDDYEPSNVPGEIWKLKNNKMGKVQRLGGIQNNSGILQMVNFIHDKIEETNGNFQSRSGLEPSKVTTFRGLAELNARADTRIQIKKAGRTQGFARLYQLTDWTALEFYNQTRIIMIRGKKADEPDVPLSYNSDQMRVYDSSSEAYYYPTLDVEITAGKGIEKSPALTLDATEKLANTPITPQNKEIVKAEIDLLDLPNKEELKQYIDNAFQPMPLQNIQGQPQQVPFEELLKSLTPEEQQAILNNPAILDEYNKNIGGSNNV